MPLGNSLQAAACLILCGAAFACAQVGNRPAPIASPTETTVVDGGLSTAPPISLPKVESSTTPNAAAELAPTGAQGTVSRQTHHMSTEIWKMSPSSLLGSTKREGNPPADSKLGLKGLLFHKIIIKKAESAE